MDSMELGVLGARLKFWPFLTYRSISMRGARSASISIRIRVCINVYQISSKESTPNSDINSSSVFNSHFLHPRSRRISSQFQGRQPSETPYDSLPNTALISGVRLQHRRSKTLIKDLATLYEPSSNSNQAQSPPPPWHTTRKKKKKKKRNDMSVLRS